MKLKEMTIGNVQPKVPGHLDDAVVASDIAKLRGVYGDDVEGAVVEFIEFYENCIDYDVPVRELLEYAAKGFNITIDEVKRIWHEEYPEDHSLDNDEPTINTLDESFRNDTNPNIWLRPIIKKNVLVAVEYADSNGQEHTTSNVDVLRIFDKKRKLFSVYPEEVVEFVNNIPKIENRITDLDEGIVDMFKRMTQPNYANEKNKLGESIMNNKKTMEWNLNINGETDVPVTIEWSDAPAEPDVGVMNNYIDEYFVTVTETGDDVTDLFTKDEIEDIIQTFGYDDDVTEPDFEDDDRYEDDRYMYESKMNDIGDIKDGSKWTSCDGAGHEVTIVNVDGKQVFYKDSEGKKRDKDVFSFKTRYKPCGKKCNESKSIFENGKLVTTFAQFIGETELVKKYPIKESDDSLGSCNDGSARDCYSIQERQAIYNAYKSVEDKFNWDGEDFVTLPGIDGDILPQHMMEIVDEFEGNYVNESEQNEVASLVESVAKIMRR